jgi:hypothetical protein
MRLRLWAVLLFLLSGGCHLAGWAQQFQNRNYYDIWITAEHKLNAGKFGESLLLYQSVPNLPDFQKKAELVKQYQVLFQDAERLYQDGRYAEALERFSRYRTLSGEEGVAIFDRRIQSCLQQLDKIQEKKLAESTRVVAGFEWAFRGQRHLSVLDTTAALRSFTKARQLGGTLNPTLREQYRKGLQETEALRQWGRTYRAARESGDPEQVLASLKNYRGVSGYIIESLEYQIRSLENKVPAVTTSAGLAAFAEACRMADLLQYVRNNAALLPEAGPLVEALVEYRQIEQDIASLKDNADNRAFVESAYQALIAKASQLPGLSTPAERCARQSYHSYLMNLARTLEKQGNQGGQKAYYQQALRAVAEAQRLGIADASALVLQQTLAAKLGCEEFARELRQTAAQVRQDLLGCRVAEARQRWEESLARWTGCGLSGTYLQPYTSLRDSLTTIARSDSLFTTLSAQANRALEASRCGEARQLYQRLGGLTLCDPERSREFLKKQLLLVSACEKNQCYTAARDKAAQYLKDKEWKPAYDFYQRAFDCASAAQQEVIRQILNDIECDAYPGLCRKSNRLMRLEPVLRIAGNQPAYSENNQSTRTSVGHFISGGLQLSLMTYSSPVDVLLGTGYFRTQFQSLVPVNGAEYAASQVEVAGMEAYVALKFHKPSVDPDRLRPYLSVGLEGQLPVSYSRQDFLTNTSTRDRSQLKKQSLGAMGALGVELQRTRFGFFAELVGTYNFSGLYNRTVLSTGSSDLREAYFRTLGLRMGVRLW